MFGGAITLLVRRISEPQILTLRCNCSSARRADTTRRMSMLMLPSAVADSTSWRDSWCATKARTACPGITFCSPWSTNNADHKKRKILNYSARDRSTVNVGTCDKNAWRGQSGTQGEASEACYHLHMVQCVPLWSHLVGSRISCMSSKAPARGQTAPVRTRVVLVNREELRVANSTVHA